MQGVAANRSPRIDIRDADMECKQFVASKVDCCPILRLKVEGISGRPVRNQTTNGQCTAQSDRHKLISGDRCVRR